jgi:hypothetical protein
VNVNIISNDNGVGLTRDTQILRRELEALGHTAAFRQWNLPPMPGCGADVNVFLEVLSARWFDLAKCNVLVPNPEWFADAWVPLMTRVDEIWCKSWTGVRQMEALGTTRMVGWTSDDRFDPSIPRKLQCFHLAGRSSAKQTDVVLDTWAANPDLPPLVMVQHEPKRQASLNVRMISGHIPDDHLRRLQNESLIHVCPSACEGYGHYIAEGMSCNAWIVTTDAGPMRDLTGGHAVLIPAELAGHTHRADVWRCSAADIAEGVRRSVQSALRGHVLSGTRKIWLDDAASFRRELADAVSNLRNKQAHPADTGACNA